VRGEGEGANNVKENLRSQKFCLEQHAKCLLKKGKEK
jgi:hypothetical protein